LSVLFLGETGGGTLRSHGSRCFEIKTDMSLSFLQSAQFAGVNVF